MTGLIIEKFYNLIFMLFSIYNTDNELKMSEYEAYWLTGFTRINS